MFNGKKLIISNVCEDVELILWTSVRPFYKTAICQVTVLSSHDLDATLTPVHPRGTPEGCTRSPATERGSGHTDAGPGTWQLLCMFPLKWGQDQHWPQVTVVRGTGRPAPSGSHGRAPQAMRTLDGRGRPVSDPKRMDRQRMELGNGRWGSSQQEARWLCLAPAGGIASLGFLSRLWRPKAGLPGAAGRRA